MKELIIQDNQIIHCWQCQGCNVKAEVPPTFYAENGEPVCGKCGGDMEYAHTIVSNLDLQKSVKQAVKDLRKASANTSGPSDLSEAFTNADDYPDFDVDPNANYLIGYLRGVAEVLGVEAATFLKG